MSTFRGLGEVIAENGLFCSLYADRASHYWHTPEAGGGVDKDNPTQVGRALAQLGIELIAAYSPQARGRSERMFGTLQKRLPQELRLAGIATMAEANRFLEELFWPAHNARFARPRTPARPSWLLPARSRTSSAPRRTASSRATTPCATRTARCRSRPIATATTTSRRRSGARISRRPPGRLPRTQVSGALPRRRRNHRRRQAPGRVTRFDATEPGPVDKWTARQSSRPDHFPTGPTTTTEAVNSYGT